MRLSGIAFSWGDAAAGCEGKVLSVTGALRRNTFQGGVEIQIRSTEPPLVRPAAGSDAVPSSSS